ncbi:MAG: SDR family oxidoreductase [Chloroflexi bacterium]|nr:SDR family oxidoreductase [Chloroflexota bacterium]
MGQLDGKVAIITGAGRGIGKGTALRFASEGASLVLNDLDPGPLQETVGEVKGLGAKAVAVAGSVADPALPTRVVQAANDTFGNLHIVVTCAGFTWDGMLHRMTDEQWQTIIDVHLTGTFRTVRAALQYMRERARQEQQAGGPLPARKIITISSQSAFGNVGQVNYSAAKAGIIGLTRVAALEGAMFNILANSLAFGLIDTRLTRDKELGEKAGNVALGIPKELREQAVQRIPLKRPGTVEEAVGPILFLASEDSNYVSGHTLEVNAAAHM